MTRVFRYVGEHVTVDDALEHCEREGLGNARLMRGETGLVRGVAEVFVDEWGDEPTVKAAPVSNEEAIEDLQSRGGNR